MPLFDTHAHYNDNAFNRDREEILDALSVSGVGAVVMTYISLTGGAPLL